MDLKQEFKQTDVGVIPEDWKTITIGEMGTFSKGQGVRKDEALSGNLPCVRYGEIYTHHNDIIRSFNSRISAEVSKKSKCLKKGDILFAGSGETKEDIGKCVAFLGDQDAYAGGDIVIFSPNQGDSKFFGYLFNSSVVVRQKASKGQGDAVVHIGANALSTIKIPLPPTKAEQEAIANALSDADSLVESLEQLIAKKRLIKQGAMQELLTGKRRLPGFEKKSGYKKTEVGVIPEDWELRRVSEFATMISSGKSRVNSKVGDYPVYGSTGIIGQCVGGDYSGRAVLVARVGANAGKLTLVDGEYGVTDNTIIIRIDGSFNLDYFWRQLEAKHLNSMIFGSGQPLITGTQIKKIILPFPPAKAEQETIVNILHDMDTEITVLETKLTKARQIKQGMMQELLTGRIRLI